MCVVCGRGVGRTRVVGSVRLRGSVGGEAVKEREKEDLWSLSGLEV